MPKVYDKTDLLWTTQGDLFIGPDGDIMDTSHDPLRSLVQEVRTRIMSDQGDWANYPELGGSIGDFVGKLNIKQTAEGLKARIISCLAQHGFISPSDLVVTYMPVAVDRLMFRIRINVARTPQNAGSESVGVNFLYNFTENNILFQ